MIPRFAFHWARLQNATPLVKAALEIKTAEARPPQIP